MRFLLSIGLAMAWCGGSLLVFEGLVWGWFDPVPNYMIPVAVVYGLACGLIGGIVGASY